MFHRIYQFYKLFREYFLLSLFLIISILMMLLNDNSQVHRIRAYSIALGGIFQNTFSFIPNYYALKEENELLRQINVNLSDEVNFLRESKLENERLVNLLKITDTTFNYKLTSTKVIAKNVSLLRNTITINKGETDGIKIGNPVVTGSGLVGKIINVSNNFSLVQLILNVDFRASAKVQRSRVDGIVIWNGKKLLLNNVAQTLDVEPGDAIISSVYSNSFPPGIKIGIVQKINKNESDLFKNIIIEPTVNFARLEEVFVLDFVPSLERELIENAATQ